MDRWIHSSPHHSLAYARDDKGSNASTSFEVLIPGPVRACLLFCVLDSPLRLLFILRSLEIGRVDA
jgi:hypothetical protein